jgi:uncharacterized protein YbjT (DUF2867 family)
MRIAVAGGTGTVGTHVVDAARAGGHEVTLLTRHAGVDLVTGNGLDAALDGIHAVIDTANITTLSEEKATEFFRTASGNLVAAAARADVGHVVLLSIVGIDRNPHAYYAAKLAQEAVYTADAVPWTILRATQFHEFAAQTFATAKAGPLHLAPRARTQPVAAREVGEHLVDLAVGPAQGRAADLAGPREEELADMVKAYARAIGYRGPVPAIAIPGAQMKGMRDGLNLPDPDAVLGRQTFAEWLAAVPKP